MPNENTLDSTAIEISCPHNKKLIIVSVYAAGHNNISVTQELDNSFTQNSTTHFNSHFILAGDINARSKDWSVATNSRGGYLNNWLNANLINLRLRFYPPSKPTFPRSNSFLDHCMIDSRLTIKNPINNTTKVLDYDSDHRAHSINIDITTDTLFESQPTKHHKNFKTKKKKKMV